jgi:hypothetical protein
LNLGASTIELGLPRISAKLTIKALQEEAQARGLEKKGLPKLKNDLLHHLVDGTIHISATDAWKKVMEYRLEIESEKGDLHEASVQKRQEAERRNEERNLARYAKEQEEHRIKAEEKLKRRLEEQKNQVKLHKHKFPLVHPHPVARTEDLKFHGKPRTALCSFCCVEDYGFDIGWSRTVRSIWTCEACDFDVCRKCFEMENISKEKKQRRAEELRKRHDAEEKERQRQEEEEERDQMIKWDATKQFKKTIIKPPAKNKDPNGNKKKGYTVWCSDGYGNDGWHSYNSPPNKEFDSTWKTKADANARARYLFYWKNVWGLSPNELAESGEGGPVEETATNQHGLVEFSVEPPDSSHWTVSVVPDEVFPHLDNACMIRHSYDDERDPKGYSDVPSYSCLSY